LFFSLGGVAIATEHYLITSTKQIAPSVLHQLRGDQGPPGKDGDRGPAGPAGPGATGATGSTGATGPDQSLDVIRVKNQISVGTGLQEVDATCPSGFVLTGGGAATGSDSSLVDSAPGVDFGESVSEQTWTAIYNVNAPNTVIVADAVCAELQTP
jgi:hypothetical protein